MKTLMLNKENLNESLSYPKWKRIGKVIKPGPLNNNKPSLTITKPELWKQQKVNLITCSDSDLFDIYYHKFEDEIRAFEKVSFGTGEKYVIEGETAFNTGVVIDVANDTLIDEPLILDYKLTESGNTLIDHNFIHIGKNSKVKVVIRYGGDLKEADDSLIYYHNGVTKILVEAGGSLEIAKVQLLDDKAYHIDNNVSIIKEKAFVRFAGIDLGGDTIATNYYAHLEGDEAANDTVTAYLGDGNKRLDIGYDCVHSGLRTKSLIDCHGALLNNARKIFRGNLKFNKGAKKSIGKESEFVLLLDKTVHSDAIPALLCDEDDVSGEHAASAGQVDEEQLFYLMSRGFSLKEAKKLIIHGFFSKVIDLLPNENLKDEVERELERRLLYGSES